VSIRYRNRERRLDRHISRIETARRAIAGRTKSASAQDAWWRRHGGTLDAWRHAIAERQHRQPAAGTATAASRFTRWTSLLRWHRAVLRLRFQCWWLTRQVNARRIAGQSERQGPSDNQRGPGA
jgi:hypothetical protein